MSRAALSKKLDSYKTQNNSDWGTRHPQKGLAFTQGSIDLRSNDYLCIAGNPQITNSKQEALNKYQHGHAQSRIWTHHEDDIYRKFEVKIANLCGFEDATITPSGYSANTGLLSGIIDRHSIVYIDKLAHASLWEGLKLSNAKVIPFAHNNIEDLIKKIQLHGSGFIIVDSLYSTNGSVAPLEKLVDISQKSSSVLIVDETHSIGTHGKNGEGITKSLGLEKEVDFITFGLSKAFAVRGGVILGSKESLDYLRYSSIPIIFTNSVLAYEVSGYIKTLDIIMNENWRREKLHNNYSCIKEGILDIGINISPSMSQIISLEIGNDHETMKVRDILEQNNIFSSYFFYPAVKKGRSLMRLTINCGLSKDNISHIVQTIKEASKKVDYRQWISSTKPQFN